MKSKANDSVLLEINDTLEEKVIKLDSKFHNFVNRTLIENEKSFEVKRFKLENS